MGLFNWLFHGRVQPTPHDDDAVRSVLAAASVGYITADYVRLTTSESVRTMTRDTWLASSDTLAMLCFLHGRGSGRKFRLFATACARDRLAQTPDQDRDE